MTQSVDSVGDRDIAPSVASVDHVVLACSLVPLRSVRFDPPLPELLRRAIDELGYGAVTKTAVQFAERQWSAGYATTEGVSQRLYEPTVDQPGRSGVLMSYAGGDAGRSSAPSSEVDRMNAIESDMRDVHGITARRPEASRGRGRGILATAAVTPVYRPGQITAFWGCCDGRMAACGWQASMPQPGRAISKAQWKAAKALPIGFMMELAWRCMPPSNRPRRIRPDRDRASSNRDWPDPEGGQHWLRGAITAGGGQVCRLPRQRR